MSACVPYYILTYTSKYFGQIALKVKGSTFASGRSVMNQTYQSELVLVG